MYQVETTVAEVCEGGNDFMCDWVYDVTGNETVAETVGWFIERPLKVLFILLIAWVINRIVRSALGRGEQRAVECRPALFLEARGSRGLSAGVQRQHRRGRSNPGDGAHVVSPSGSSRPCRPCPSTEPRFPADGLHGVGASHTAASNRAIMRCCMA